MGVATTNSVPATRFSLMTFSRIVAFSLGWLVIVTITACQVTPPAAPTQPGAGAPRPAEDPTILLQRAANAPADQAALMRLDAARMYFDRGAGADAQATLQRIAPAMLDAINQFEFYQLSLRLALDADDLSAANAAAGRAIPMNPQQRNAFAQTSATLAEREQRFADAAAALMAYDYDLSNPAEAPQQLIDRTWADVNRTPLDRMAALAGSSNPTASAWWELVMETQRSFDLNAEQGAVDAWRAQHPRHPAAIWVPTALRRVEAPSVGPRQFALLLPTTGPLADAGRAVRDGFMAAFYYAGSDSVVRVYDSNAGNMTDLYDRAVREGAQVVVGPLDKAKVVEMNAVANRTVPVLALNYLPDGTTPSAGLLQFGLAIEDDARAIARRMYADGQIRVVVLEADADWAHRASRAFAEQFTALGGVVATTATAEDARTITDVVGSTLLVDASTARLDELSATLGVKPEFLPRRRTDIDAIVAFVGPVQARALNPALAFHFATAIPVYATAQATGTASGTELADLNGFRLTELPWQIYPSSLRTGVNTAFALVRSPLAPLYALGVDAYRVADRAQSLTSAVGGLFGETGQLQVRSSGSLLREPAWAVVNSGRLVALPTVVQ
jgi:uncharacterized protein